MKFTCIGLSICFYCNISNEILIEPLMQQLLSLYNQFMSISVSESFGNIERKKIIFQSFFFFFFFYWLSRKFTQWVHARALLLACIANLFISLFFAIFPIIVKKVVNPFADSSPSFLLSLEM